jgi:hypothetical protein
MFIRLTKSNYNSRLIPFGKILQHCIAEGDFTPIKDFPDGSGSDLFGNIIGQYHKTITMNIKALAAILAITILTSCNETSTQSGSSKDSTVTQDSDNTTLSPGTADPARNGIMDSSVNKTDSLARDKR